MHPDSLRIARHWLLTGLEKARDFIVLQNDIDWLNTRTPAFFEELSLRCHHLTPHPVAFVDIPKDNGDFRHVAIPSLRDRLLMTALVADNYDAMIANIFCCQKEGVDYQYPLPAQRQDTRWVNEWSETFRAFIGCGREFEQAGQVVLYTDIRNFAPSCDPKILQDKLIASGWKPESVVTLGKFLASWEKQGHKGIPQAMVITEMLTKVYLSDVDRKLGQLDGITYFRYSDDIRIAGPDQATVKEAHRYLTLLLGGLGLELNAEKTYFSDDPLRKSVFKVEEIYGPLLQERGVTDGLKGAGTVPVDILEAVYVQHLSPGRHSPAIPNQTLFNFTINRLAKEASQIAHPDLMNLVDEHPGKIPELVRYAVKTGYRDFPELVESFRDPRLRDHLIYTLLRCGLEMQQESRAVPAEIRELAANCAADQRLPDYLKAKSRDLMRMLQPSAGQVDILLDLQP